jgi:hypothetical protein
MEVVNSGENNGQLTTTAQMEDEDLLAEIPSPEMPNLLELLNNDGSPRTDGEKLLQLKNLEGWQNQIRTQCKGHEYLLVVRTTDEAMLAFIAMLMEMTKGCIMLEEYQPAVPTTCQIEHQCALVSPMRPFRM